MGDKSPKKREEKKKKADKKAIVSKPLQPSQLLQPITDNKTK